MITVIMLSIDDYATYRASLKCPYFTKREDDHERWVDKDLK